MVGCWAVHSVGMSVNQQVASTAVKMAGNFRNKEEKEERKGGGEMRRGVVYVYEQTELLANLL